MESLADTVGLRPPGLCILILDATHAEKKLVAMLPYAAAVFRASTRHYPQNAHALLFEKRQDFVIEHIGGNNRHLSRVQLGRCQF